MAAAITARLTRLPVIELLRRPLSQLFTRYLFFTNTGICMCMSGIGDLMQQHYDILMKRESSWDPKRTRHIVATGAAIGPVIHYWYQVLDWVLPGKGFRVIGKKVLLDQIVFSPVNISLFFLTLGWLEGKTKAQISDDLKHKGKDLLVVEWVVWPPAQLINFFFLPTRYRVLFDNSVSLAFDFYYSHVTFRKYKDHPYSKDEETSCDIVPSSTENSEAVPSSNENSELCRVISALNIQALDSDNPEDNKVLEQWQHLLDFSKQIENVS